MDCSTQGFPVHHRHPELSKTHVHWVGDAIQPSHPQSPPSPTAFNLSQHQGLFQWVSSSLQVAKVLGFQLQHQSFQWIRSDQSLSRVWLFATPWIAAHQASLSITNSRSLLKLMSVESVMRSNHLILCRPLLLPPSIFLSIRVFSNESVLLSICPSNEYSGLISFRMDWLDLLAVQGLSRVFSNTTVKINY